MSVSRLSLLLTLIVVSGCMGSQPMMAGAAADAAFTDPQVVGSFSIHNTGEIITSEPVVDAAGVPANVRQFAQRMITEHSAANERALALGIAPVLNSHAVVLQNNAQATAEMLRGMSGMALAEAYTRSQVVLHDNTLKTLRTTLIPAADDAQLRALLEQTVPVIERHLEEAKRLHHDVAMQAGMH